MKTIKCDVCKKDCICKYCVKQNSCKHLKEEKCKVRKQCGMYKEHWCNHLMQRFMERS